MLQLSLRVFKFAMIELAAVITYERNSFGNKMGDMIQPAQIKALR